MAEPSDERSEVIRWLTQHDALDGKVEEFMAECRDGYDKLAEQIAEVRREQGEFNSRQERILRKLEGDPDDRDRYPGLDNVVMKIYRRQQFRAWMIAGVVAVFGTGIIAGMLKLLDLLRQVVAG